MARATSESNLYKQLVDALNALFGVHPGYRPAHAKGIVCEGTFTPAEAGRTLPRTAHLQGADIPVTVRFSTPLQEFLAAHPAVKRFAETATPPPVSFATESYYGVDTFRFVNDEGDSDAEQHRLLFDPARLVDGIEPLGDPLIAARSQIYAFSYGRRD